LIEVLLQISLTIVGIFFAVGSGYMYHKDGDKRKLMFLLSFAFSSVYFLAEIETGLELIQRFNNFFTWSVFPMMCAFSIAVFSSVLKLKNFDKPFKIFLFILAASIFMMIVPLQVNSLQPLLFSSMSFIVIAVSSYLYLTRRKFSDIIFLLSVVCFTSGGLGTTFNLGIPFTVFSFTFAYILLALVFTTSRESERGGIASFFSLKREFEKTQEELEVSRDQLMRAEVNFRSLVNLIADPVVIIDHKGQILEINDKVVELTGFSKEELLGKNFLQTDLLTMKSKAIAMKSLMKRMMGIDVKPYEIEANKKSGETVYLEISAQKIEYKGKSADLVVFRDITEQKKIQKRLLRSERLAAIGQASTMVGHDLRNPLQAIENAAYVINTEMSTLPVSKITKETLQAMHRSIEYADNIVRDLQSFALEREPKFTETDINVIAKGTLYFIKTPENVETIFDLGQLPEIEADEDMIKRVFVNLAVNGIQAMKEKGGTLKVSTKNSNGFVEVSFEDTGVGIPKENLRKLFTPFFTTKAQGMGVGLAICKRFVELHGGSIMVESEEGEGSVFTVKLPIQRNGGGRPD